MVAGLLALGAYPQQFFPRFVIQVAAEPLPEDPPAVRARNQVTITGPIPRWPVVFLPSAHRLPPAQYADTGIRSTVLLRRPAGMPAVDVALGATELRVYRALAAGPKAVAELVSALGLTEPNVRRVLRSLRGRGLVRQEGGKGRPTTYHRIGRDLDS